MDKQTTVQAEGSKSGRKGRSAETPAEQPVVSAEATAPETVVTAPKRSVLEQFKEATARQQAAEADLTSLANRVAATGQTQLVIDGKVLLIRKERGSEDHYFYDPTTAKVKKEKAKKGPVSADELLV